MTRTLFGVVDDITSCWRRLEERLCETELREEGFPLSIERQGGRMRICYSGKPITDCKMTEKIEAAFFLERLLEKLQQRDEVLIGRAKEALRILERCTGD